MNIYFDIGGTNFRCFICDLMNNNCEKIIEKTQKLVLYQIDNHIKKILKRFKINNIIIALPGIIKKNRIYNINNLNLDEGTKLLEIYDNIKIKYINDGDAFVIGETINTLLSPTNKNILGIIFGTGVGGGLIIKGKIIYNCEVEQYFEDFMKNNYLSINNLDLVTSYIAHQLEKLIKILNLDYILINGYVNKFEDFGKMINDKIKLNKFYNTKIIICKSEDSNLVGLKMLSAF